MKLLDRGPLPDFWRAPTDNDIGAWKSLGNAARTDPALDILAWRSAGPGWKVTDVQVKRVDENAATITVEASLPRVGGALTMTYEIRGTGEVAWAADYRPAPGPVAMMPRFGLELVASPGLEQARRGTGAGPAKPTATARSSASASTRSTVAREWVEYARPQENGNKADVRWVELTNAQGIRPAGRGPAAHERRRPPRVIGRHRAGAPTRSTCRSRPEIYLNLDMAQMGVGGIDSWTRLAYPMDAYRISGTEPHAYRSACCPSRAAPKSPPLRRATGSIPPPASASSACRKSRAASRSTSTRTPTPRPATRW